LEGIGFQRKEEIFEIVTNGLGAIGYGFKSNLIRMPKKVDTKEYRKTVRSTPGCNSTEMD
jgi:hypothetical protein